MPRINWKPHEVQSQFRDALRTHHLELNEELVADGQIHRCDAVNKPGHSGRGDGAYLLHLDGNIPYGGFQNWTEDKEWQSWHFDPGRELTTAEQLELRLA